MKITKFCVYRKAVCLLNKCDNQLWFLLSFIECLLCNEYRRKEFLFAKSMHAFGVDEWQQYGIDINTSVSAKDRQKRFLIVKKCSRSDERQISYYLTDCFAATFYEMLSFQHEKEKW